MSSLCNLVCYCAPWTLQAYTLIYLIMKVSNPLRKCWLFKKPPNSLPQNNYITELLKVVLTKNHFEFNGKHYHQVSGTAMGTKLAPSYANLFMAKFEGKYVYTYPLQPKLWKRFIDDIFFHMASWNGFTLGIHKPFEYSAFHY